VTTRYNPTIHNFVMLNALAGAAPTRAAVAQSVDFLKRVLAPSRVENMSTSNNDPIARGILCPKLFRLQRVTTAHTKSSGTVKSLILKEAS